MLENFNEDKRKNPMTQFSDFHTGMEYRTNFLCEYFILLIIVKKPS